VKTTFGAKVAIKSIGQEGSLERTQDKRSNKLEGHYVPIVVGGIKHMDTWVELYRMVKKAI